MSDTCISSFNIYWRRMKIFITEIVYRGKSNIFWTKYANYKSGNDERLLIKFYFTITNVKHKGKAKNNETIEIV